MDLAMDFFCIPHDLLKAKFHAYSFNEKSVTFIYSDLRRWKQNAQIDDILSTFQTQYQVYPKVPS